MAAGEKAGPQPLPGGQVSRLQCHRFEWPGCSEPYAQLSVSRVPRPAQAEGPAATVAAMVAATLALPTGWRAIGGWRCRTSSSLAKALVGLSVPFHWPNEGLVCGNVAQIERAAGFSHMVAYGPQSPAVGALIP